MFWENPEATWTLEVTTRSVKILVSRLILSVKGTFLSIIVIVFHGNWVKTIKGRISKDGMHPTFS